MYSKSCTAQKVQKKKDEEAERLWRVQDEVMADQGDLFKWTTLELVVHPGGLDQSFPSGPGGPLS